MSMGHKTFYKFILKKNDFFFKELSSIKNLAWFNLQQNHNKGRKRLFSFRYSEKNRSFYSKFKVSRFRFRQLQAAGLIPIKKK